MPIMPEQTTAGEFVGRWKERDLTERAGAQAHFIDLCRLLAVPAPTDNRITDSDYGFEARTDNAGFAVRAALTSPNPHNAGQLRGSLTPPTERPCGALDREPRFCSPLPVN